MTEQPGVGEVSDGEVPLHQKHVLEQRAGGVGPVGHALVQRAVRHVLQEDHGLLHDGQHLLGPQVGLLQVTWNTAGGHLPIIINTCFITSSKGLTHFLCDAFKIKQTLYFVADLESLQNS